MSPTAAVLAAVAASLSQTAASITPANTSLATVPTGYFGGNYQRRGEANIAMLAKHRIVMIEKWEGHCWQDCLTAGKPTDPSCLPGCAVENDIIDTHRRVKAINSGVCSILYLNTLLDFPFYTLHGKFVAANALVMDNTTGKPLSIRNDNGMEDINVFGFDSEVGQQLYVEALKNLTATGVVDGFFGDKWDKGATLDAQSNQYQICNHECGNVSAEVAAAWNAGKTKVLEAGNALLGNGPWFANGNTWTEDPPNEVPSNFHGSWGGQPLLHKGDPRGLVSFVQQGLQNHTYLYVSSTGDQHWETDPNDPASLVSTCNADCTARFLLAVEVGAFLGTNGWDPTYELPLGDPAGPATYKPGSADGSVPATLSRNFSSGTYVVFTYDKGNDGAGVVYWGGKPAPPAPPAPPPAPPAPPAPPGPEITCGDAGIKVTLLPDTTFALQDVAVVKAGSAQECCNACANNPKCLAFSLHDTTRLSEARGSGKHGCHLHGPHSEKKHQRKTVSGVVRN